MHVVDSAMNKENNYSKALEYLDEELRINPSNFKAYLYRGICQVKLNMYPKAVVSFEKAITIEHNNPEAFIYLAFLNMLSGNLDQASIFIKEVLANKNEYHGRAYELSGDLYNKFRKNYSEADKYYASAIKLNPDNPHLYLKKALCCYNLGDYKECIRNAEIAFELDNNMKDAESIINAAVDLHLEKKYKIKNEFLKYILSFFRVFFKENLKDQLNLRDEMIEINRRTEELSWDPAFKIRTKTFFDSKYSALVDESKNSNKFISVLLFDVDNMKIFNEVYGHRILNQFLGYSGDFMNKSVSDKDICARWGGDELIIVLPNTEKEGAEAVYNNFNSLLSNLNETKLKEMGIKQPFTFSVGLATAPVDMEDNNVSWSDQLFDKADLAVKFAKLNGKNQIVIFDLKKKDEWENLRDKAAKEDKEKAEKGERPV